MRAAPMSSAGLRAAPAAFDRSSCRSTRPDARVRSAPEHDANGVAVRGQGRVGRLAHNRSRPEVGARLIRARPQFLRSPIERVFRGRELPEGDPLRLPCNAIAEQLDGDGKSSRPRAALDLHPQRESSRRRSADHLAWSGGYHQIRMERHEVERAQYATVIGPERSRAQRGEHAALIALRNAKMRTRERTDRK